MNVAIWLCVKNVRGFINDTNNTNVSLIIIFLIKMKHIQNNISEYRHVVKGVC